MYLQRVESFRQTESLFINYGLARRRQKPAISTLSRGIRSLISMAYRVQGLVPPSGIQGRSTHSMSSTATELQGDTLVEICRALLGQIPLHLQNTIESQKEIKFKMCLDIVSYPL